MFPTPDAIKISLRCFYSRDTLSDIERQIVKLMHKLALTDIYLRFLTMVPSKLRNGSCQCQKRPFDNNDFAGSYPGRALDENC